MYPAIRVFIGLALSATLFSTSVFSSTAATSGASVRANKLNIHLAPNPAHVHKRLSVSVSGLRPGEGLSFVVTRIPRTQRFGGPVGTFYANNHGVLRFRYPPFEFNQEIGRWEVIGYRPDGAVAVSTVFRVEGS